MFLLAGIPHAFAVQRGPVLFLTAEEPQESQLVKYSPLKMSYRALKSSQQS